MGVEWVAGWQVGWVGWLGWLAGWLGWLAGWLAWLAARNKMNKAGFVSANQWK